MSQKQDSYAGWKPVGILAILPLVIAPNAPYLDRPKAADEPHTTLTAFAALVSSLCWLISVPFMLVGAASFPPLVLLVPIALHLWARRISMTGVSPAAMTIGEWVRRHRSEWATLFGSRSKKVLVTAGGVLVGTTFALVPGLFSRTGLLADLTALIAAVAGVGILVFETRIGLANRRAANAYR
jgi:hypothetical protein